MLADVRRYWIRFKIFIHHSVRMVSMVLTPVPTQSTSQLWIIYTLCYFCYSLRKNGMEWNGMEWNRIE